MAITSEIVKGCIGNKPVEKIYKGNILQYIKSSGLWEIGIITTVDNLTFGLNRFDGTPNVTIDWGDGTTQTKTDNKGGVLKTYATASTYTVKISGSFGNISFGPTSAESSRIQSTSVIPTIPGLTSLVNCFMNSSLTFLPADLFAKCTAVTNFLNCFLDCNLLTSVPATLFANNTAVTTFGDCFQGVTLTTESYSNLLINMASNAASRLNNVSFGGGNSKYNAAGQTARNILIAKGWSFSDGGLE